MGSLEACSQTRRRDLAASLNEPVAIVGIGCRFPGDVSGPSSLWKLLSEPRDIAKPVPASRFGEDSFAHPDASHHGTTNNQKAYWLEQDHKVFDAAFFNVSPREAEAMDPQHRFLLETTYEALEDAGIPLHETRGTDTAVFVGQMTADFHDVQMRNIDTLATYAATGGARSITSNRLSYYFDWHGPSLTLDTACSSSLLAVHYAVQTLRLGDARVAVAAGCTLNLGPEMFVMESNLSMLSPRGQSRMFDSGADGYGRGEGFSVVILKTLQDALADDDHIYSVIRATGANQDGRTTGIAMPSAEAQARLIRSTYQRAGLDPTAPSDRCQLFEAHGTGTPTGDPLEAEAICKAFFPTRQPKGEHAENDDAATNINQPPLYCGSIKTVIGHTEGAAGLAGLLKATLAVQNAEIPANLHFETASPRVQPFMDHLRIPTSRLVWPSNSEQPPSSASCRRASVNSFGFGGTNVHAIVESFRNPSSEAISEDDDVLTPVVLSSATNQSLAGVIQKYVDYLTENTDVSLKQLCWTLQERRTWFDHRLAFTGRTRQSLIAQMSTALKNGVENVAPSPVEAEKPKVLAVFTGQGAQWVQMGRKLLYTSACFAHVMNKLQHALDSLPEVSDRPGWTLKGELELGSTDSRIHDAEICQPLCTAVQIALVDLLRAAGVEFDVVIGHSSGEIAAAYAAGHISASTAVIVAYYRGLVTKTSCNPHSGRVKGAMIAVALGWEEAQELCADPRFAGDVTVAASNSPQSVTLSGEADKVREIQRVLKDRKISATLLRIDKAYHSRFMEPCAAPYLEAMRTAGYNTVKGPECALNQSFKRNKRPLWISSVTQSLITADNVPDSLRDGSYWVDNLLSPVRFREAIEAIPTLTDISIQLALELGPHPALRRQATQTYQSVARTGKQSLLPYSGSLSRGVDDEEAMSNLLGFLWQSGVSVDFEAYRNACKNPRNSRCQTPQRTPLSGLPSYVWDHSRQYWRESTRSMNFSNRLIAQSDLLGRCVERGGPGTGTEWRWSNILRLSELPWLKGHQLERQVVFPAAGYCIIAADAAVQMAQLEGEEGLDGLNCLDWCELRDVAFHRAIQISNDGDTETLVRLRETDAGSCEYEFSISARPAVNGNGDFWLASSGKVVIARSAKMPDVNGGIADSEEKTRIPETSRAQEPVHLRPLDVYAFYAGFSEVGLQYSDAFRLDSIERTLCRARATISGPISGSIKPESGTEKQRHQGKYLSFPPASLDAAFQTTAAALAFPGDGQMQAPYLPTSIRRLHFNLMALNASSTSQRSPRFVFDALLADPDVEEDIEDQSLVSTSSSTPEQRSQGLSSSIEGIDETTKQILFRVEGLGVVPLARKHDPYGEGIFFEEVWAPDITDALAHFEHESDDPLDSIEFVTAERLALYYMRQVFSQFRPEEAASDKTPWYIRRFYDWLRYRLENVPLEQHHGVIASCPEEILDDVPESARESIRESVLVKLLDAVGQNTVRVMRQEEGPTMLEVLFTDDMLSRMYVEPTTIARANRYLGRAASVIAHRFPRCNMIEIGAGTGGATGSMLAGLQGSFKSYTFTDVSAGFFSAAKNRFHDQPGADRMVFKTLDVEKSVTEQGFEEGSYDVVIASNVIHATKDVLVALGNARCLLKPGGYLLLLEVTSSPLIVPFLMGVIPGWWLHDDEYRHGTHSPLMDETTWDKVLRRSGFSGVDFGFQDMRDKAKHISSVMVAQATDGSWEPFFSGKDSKPATLNLDTKPSHSDAPLSARSVETRDLVVVRGLKDQENQRVNSFLDAILQYVGNADSGTFLPTRVTSFQNLEEIAAHKSSGLLAKPTTTVLVLSDLYGKPVLQEPVRESEFLAIKHIFDNATNVIWVTQRRHSHQPEHNMIVGLGRCVARESLNLKLQFIDVDDFEDKETPRVVARILRQTMMFANGNTTPSSATDAWLWSQESELVVERGGKLLLPRLKPIEKSNKRYLAHRRRVLEGEGRQQEREKQATKTTQFSSRVAPSPSTLFRGDRTYFFAGLTGDLALSLAKWMLANGARYIAMASRRPQIPSVWLDEMQHMQPDVKIQILQMDVTSKESVRNGCDKIARDMAPIAGVIFGAMVLNDTIFSNMSLPALTTTLAPKVEGARNLDEYFYHSDLDFFIFTSSFSCIVGTRGQSNYSAANMFGRALMAQRRDIRGLAASTVDLSTVFGVGYFSGADTEKQKNVLLNLRGLNAMAVSERDLHAAVYEAILRGRPGGGTQVDLLVGLGTETAFAHRDLPVWHDEPRFSHVTLFGTEGTRRADKNGGGLEDTGASAVNVGLKLGQVNSAEDKTAVLSSCLGDEIASTMLLDKAHMKSDVPLTDLGVDSLVAVDLRAWFFKELGINVPVLRILNGDSIRALCKAALLEFNALS